LTAYADTSVLVSVYLEDIHSHKIGGMLSHLTDCFLTPLHRAEWFHAVAQHVFRGTINETKAGELHVLFEKDVKTGAWLEVALPDNAFDLCANLARQYGPKLGMGTLDTLHVACAIELKAERFWTFDEQQAKLAKAQGLKTT
jgi:predicted nucleic acid-binding protein